MAKNAQLQEAEKKIKRAQSKSAKKLNLSGHQLTALPESLGQLTQLMALDLSNNQLTALPESLGRLTQLKALNLSNNQLTALPESLGQLTQLKALDLSNNQLTALPESLGQLMQLQTLDLSHNLLAVLPESLGQLTQLQTLELSSNQLKELPKSFSKLINLEGLLLSCNHFRSLPNFISDLCELRVLSLSDNLFTSFPPAVCKLFKLETFGATYNQIQNIPEDIGDLSNLKTLVLGGKQWISKAHPVFQSYSTGREPSLNGHEPGNLLTTLPDSLGRLTQLESLVLESNRLTALPESLRRCERLKVLYLHGNEALGIPPEVLGPRRSEFTDLKHFADPRAILDWYFQSRAESAQRLNEAKMLLVGQGGVGKTSLVHYLIHNKPCNPAELPTEGINIEDWGVHGKKNTDGEFERVNVHIWDFGGQEIMHATHQFFLTRRSLYLLVIDARAGEKESNIHYWLKIIQSYGGDSPVLVVVNKCDQHPHELNETRLKCDYPSIRSFIQTSCCTGQGIAELRREIGKHIRRLPHVFDELPKSYFAVKEELEHTAQEKNYIPINDYREICRRRKVDKPESQDRLIRFLHDLGVVLNFQDPKDPFGQNDPFVLNPEWVTGGVYAIVNDKELKAKRDGLLTPQKLKAVLNALDGYPMDRHDFIVRKMMQFELAYQIDAGRQTRWLIPELLDPKEPSNLDWKPYESLNFQYAYPVLPAGVLCRFIVRMHQYVDRKRSWRSGTVLKIDGNTVLVRGDPEKNRAFIAVQGGVDSRRERLAIVRDAFRYVHSTIPALKPKEEVPLPDKPEITVSYPHLLKLGRVGEQTYFPEGAERSYAVVDLLNGVDSALYRLRRHHDRNRTRREMGAKHVFVSYCHDNKDAVARLVEELENKGEPVWWDEDILGGRDWKEAIREAMDNAYAFVVCLSPQLTEERYRSGVYPEIRDAISTFRQYGPGHAFVFPVRLADCEVPAIEIDDTRTLKRIQRVDLFPESERGIGMQKLLESLAAARLHP